MLDADAELLSILQYVLLIEIKSSTPAHGAMFVLNTYIEIKKKQDMMVLQAAWFWFGRIYWRPIRV